MISVAPTPRNLLGLAGVLLLITACSVPVKHAPANAETVVIAHATPAPLEQREMPAPPEASSAKPPGSPWQRLRDRFAMPGCEQNRAMFKQAQVYTRAPARFTDTLRNALPLLLLVIDEIERRNLPGEYALLPFVESHYRLLPARGPGPAGIWQLMPRTAIDRGLVVTRERDDRLDPVRSTRVALDLLERYDREFSDWRLASMAFNAGEYRLKAQLRARTSSMLTAAEIALLDLSPTTHQHLARLLAMACIVTEPERFGVELPQAADDDLLSLLTLSRPVDLHLAAALAGLSHVELLRYNPGKSSFRAEPAGTTRLLLPKSRVNRFIGRLARVPADRRSAWKSFRVLHPGSLDTLAARLGVSGEVIAAANNIQANVELSTGQELLVPDRHRETAPTADAGFHVIRSGETLSGIARIHGKRVAELLRWNSLEAHSILRVGARLWIRAPEY